MVAGLLDPFHVQPCRKRDVHGLHSRIRNDLLIAPKGHGCRFQLGLLNECCGLVQGSASNRNHLCNATALSFTCKLWEGHIIRHVAKRKAGAASSSLHKSSTLHARKGSDPCAFRSCPSPGHNLRCPGKKLCCALDMCACLTSYNGLTEMVCSAKHIVLVEDLVHGLQKPSSCRFLLGLLLQSILCPIAESALLCSFKFAEKQHKLELQRLPIAHETIHGVCAENHLTNAVELLHAPHILLGNCCCPYNAKPQFARVCCAWGSCCHP